MATLLYRLGKTAYRRWPIFIAAWLVALIALGAAAGALSKPMSNTFSIPGIESVEASETMADLFPEAAAVDAPSATIVVAAPEGKKLSDQPYASTVAALVADLNDNDDITQEPAPVAGPVEAAAGLQAQAMGGVDQAEAAATKAGQPFDRAAAEAAATKSIASATPLSEDGRIGIISFTFDEKTLMDVLPEMQEKVTEAVDTARDAEGDLTVEVSGAAMESQEMGGASAELIGIALALVILAMTFGSLVAAGMPIITAGIGVVIGISGITAMTAFAEVPSTTTALASMLGLAVGIDYTLFILARYRNELDHTDDKEEATGVAVGTAGSAVVFAGLTVIIALLALGVVGISFLTAMGIGAAVTVTVAVLISLTLVPAILGMLKNKTFGGTFRRYVPKRDAQGKIDNFGVRWANLLGRKPIMWVLLVVVGLGALAIPVKDMHLALPSDSTAAKDTTQRKASDLVTEAFGPGRLSPMLVVVDARGVDSAAEQQAAYQKVVDWAANQKGVVNAMLASSNEQGAMVLIEPATSADDTKTEALLESLRESEAGVEKETGTTLGITGMSPIQTDVSKKLSDALPVYLAIVIGLAFLLLIGVFRSLLVPLTATLGFLLSVMATLGATVLIFQEGTFGIFPGQPIVSFIPIFLIGVVFGLAMDYQVFLVTRIREAKVHGASYREAVVDGFRNSARVVTAAALIMTAVFAGFIFMDNAIIKSMGFALAAAVIFDAFVVRLVLIPALLYLMGDAAWWLPKWLDKIVLKVDIEGENLHRPYMADHHGGSQQKAETVDAGH